MKKQYFIFALAVLLCQKGLAQVIDNGTEQQLEHLSELTESETEDDSYLQQLQHYLHNPLNINAATETDLQAFTLLTPLQIQNLLAYRKLLGGFVHLLELQAVPGWDVATIQKFLPYIIIKEKEDDVLHRFGQGEQTLLVRASRLLQQPKSSGAYAGGLERLLFRYQYRYKNTLQYGLLADKDAGEPLLQTKPFKGFDFYSFHLFACQLGVVKALAIGDFTVNMGQGLIQWQSLAFKKSADVLAVARLAPVLKPYQSAGEFYFNRGAGATFQKGSWEATVFGSVRNLDAPTGFDSVSGKMVFSSFNTTGLHRTANELLHKKGVQQIGWGSNLTYKAGGLKMGVNFIQHHFSKALQKRAEPFNLYAINGTGWYNASADYGYTFKNVYWFGEAAVAKNGNLAFMNGLLVSADPKVDISLLYRHIPPQYAALYGNAFTESAQPANENGFYAGISLRPVQGWNLSAYADFYKFPWLKYRINAPGHGQDYLLQLTWQPTKEFEAYARYRQEGKSGNNTLAGNALQAVEQNTKENVRLHFSYKIMPALTLKGRAEAVWYNKKKAFPEEGFLTFLESSYKGIKNISVAARWQYFETGGYNSRIYAYESDVLYSYSIPAFSGKGQRYFFIFNYDVSQRLTGWLRLAQTRYSKEAQTTNEPDNIRTRKQTEIKVQLQYIF